MASADLALLVDRLQLAATASRLGRRGVAVLALEIHRRGAQVTEEEARALEPEIRARIAGCVERVDTVTEAGPARFVVLLERAVEGPFAIHVADHVVQAMRAPFRVGERALSLVASVGVSSFPEDGDSTEVLLRRAEQACEGARMIGGDLVGFCSSSVSEAAHRRLTLERTLVGVLERGELHLAYQPQIDIQEERVIGAEALLRWTHPSLGRVSPAEFIPILEETGAILAVGAWVLDEACRQAAAWQSTQKPLRVSANVSARQLEAPGFLALVEETLARHTLDPALLEIELTETVLVENPAATRAVLASLRQRGLRVAIDDFGTGYASLAYIRHFPMDTLKIDREFVSGLPDDAEAAAITSAIVALGHSLELEMVAEGVETQAEQDFLHAQRCYVVQGYHHARPMSALDLDAWRRDHPWL